LNGPQDISTTEQRRYHDDLHCDHVSAGQRARECKNGNGELALFAATSLWNGFVNRPVIVEARLQRGGKPTQGPDVELLAVFTRWVIPTSASAHDGSRYQWRSLLCKLAEGRCHSRRRDLADTGCKEAGKSDASLPARDKSVSLCCGDPHFDYDASKAQRPISEPCPQWLPH